MQQKIVNCTFTLSSIQELHTLSEIQDDIGNIVIVYTRDCETMASARMYVSYTHRAVIGASVHVLVSMLVKLFVCETSAVCVPVDVWARKPGIVEVFVKGFCCDICCQYVCRVV